MPGTFEMRRLRYFVKVAELRSLTRAAETLHVAQPALSHHMHALESELGVQLLERGPRGVGLTEAGRQLLEETRRMLADMQQMVERVKAGSPVVEGEVVVGIGQTVGSLLAAPLIETAMRRLPRVRIQVREMMSGLLPDLVRSREIDFAISYNIADGDGVESVGLLTEDMCVVGQRRLLDGLVGSMRSSTIELDRLGNVPLFLSRRSHAMRELLERSARTRRVTLDIDAEIDSLYIMKDLVMRGVGCGIFSMANVYRELKHHDLRVLRIVRPAIRREVCLVRRQGQVTSRAARELSRIAVDVLLDLVRDGVWQATPRGEPADIRNRL
ncbi:MAG TPA: LysR family transcriptional regulator [Burkholderiaceae bacterium]|nr:LysR family transcriptional regulator [Burkholderiaceae bacterium]